MSIRFLKLDIFLTICGINFWDIKPGLTLSNKIFSIGDSLDKLAKVFSLSRKSKGEGGVLYLRNILIVYLILGNYYLNQ